MSGTELLLVLIVAILNCRRWTMNGARAKALRSMANFDLKTWRNLTPKQKYNIKDYIYIKYAAGKPVKFVSLTLFVRGDKALYKHLKKQYKRRNKR